jgi:glycosyltransferase involved in cell wall biosynthesis
MQADLESVLLLGGRIEFCGPSMYTLNLAKGLKRAGLRLKLLCSGLVMEEEFQRAGIPVRVCPFLDGLVLDWFLLRNLVRELRHGEYQILHIQDHRKIKAGVTLAKKLKIPAVATVPSYPGEREKIPVNRKILRGIITFSEELRADLVNRHKVAKDLVWVIPLGVDTHEEERIERAVGSGEVAVVGMVGAIRSGSGVDTLLRAATVVLEKEKKVHFLLVGGVEKRERGRFRKLVKELGLERHVTFADHVTSCRKVLPAVDVFVTPVQEDGPREPLLEAMAHGSPVVASGVGGIYEIVKDEETGLLFPPGQPEALAGCILRLLEDRDFARGVGEKAKEFVAASYGLGKMIEDTLSLYGKARESRLG